MDDVTNDVEQVVTAVAGDVVADNIEEARIDAPNATADATTDAKLNGHTAAEDTASSPDRAELVTVTAAQIRSVRPGVQPGLRLGMPG
jgi:hypothetical protein